MTDQLSDEQLTNIQKELEKTEQILVPTSELGTALIAEANKKYRSLLQEKVMNDVHRLMVCRDESKAAIKNFTLSADWYTRKLAAIEAGEFTFDTHGNIFMNDVDLRRANY